MGRDAREHGLEHRSREPPGIGVEARAMVAVEEPDGGRQGVLGTVCKGIPAGREAEACDHGHVRDRAEGEECREAGQGRDLGGEEGAAGRDLGRGGLVLRGHAAHRIGDARGHEGEAVRG